MTIVVTVRNKLPEVQALVSERVGLSVEKMAFSIEADAKQRAPVDTGFLRSAIQAELIGEHKAEVVSWASYSAYQEFGTYKMSAQPYMVPAAENVGSKYGAFFKGLA